MLISGRERNKRTGMALTAGSRGRRALSQMMATLALAASPVLIGTASASAAGVKPISVNSDQLYEICDPTVRTGAVERSSCTGEYVYSGDISGNGTYELEYMLNLTSGVITAKWDIAIEDACVMLGGAETCGGELFATQTQSIKFSDKGFRVRVETTFHGGTGSFDRAHGSMRAIEPLEGGFSFVGHLGL